MPHLKGIDVAVSPSVSAASQRSCTPEHLQQLLALIAQHGPQKLPAVFTFAETMHTARDSSRSLQLPAVWRDSFKEGLAELGPRLTSLRVSDPTLFQVGTSVCVCCTQQHSSCSCDDRLAGAPTGGTIL